MSLRSCNVLPRMTKIDKENDNAEIGDYQNSDLTRSDHPLHNT